MSTSKASGGMKRCCRSISGNIVNTPNGRFPVFDPSASEVSNDCISAAIENLKGLPPGPFNKKVCFENGPGGCKGQIQ